MIPLKHRRRNPYLERPNRNPLEDLNSQAKQTPDQTREQVLIAADNYFNLIQQTIASYSTGDTELGEKLKSYASRNIAATREFLKGDEPSERIARERYF